MIDLAIDNLTKLFDQGGWVMWVLVAMSLLAMTLAFERFWFWLRAATARPRFEQVAALLRAGEKDAAATLVGRGSSVYAQVVRAVLSEPGNEAAALAAIESQRGRLERFMPTLSTIITAAPMLGILGTVTGIISSFDLLSQKAQITDPREISGGIAEALLTTAAGLIVALVVLFPYNAFRAQIERTLGQFESLIAAAESGRRGKADRDDR